MTQNDKRLYARAWKEFWGKRKVMQPIPFTETSILTQPEKFRVDTLGYFLTLPTMTVAIVTSSTGQNKVFTKGGYKELQKGAYTIQYVDLSERFFNFPRIAASTIDGREVAFSISISYKVNDPALIIKIASPLQTLFSVCEAAIQNFIVTNLYEEITNRNKEIDNYLIQQVNQNKVGRAFNIIDVILVSYEDSHIGQLKQRNNVERRQDQEELEKIIAEQNRIIKDFHAQFEAAQSEILELVHRLKIEQEFTRKKNIPVNDDIKLWDVFISHAFEDKSFARALADELVNNGLRVWFDEFELKIGDSLSRKIDFGLSNSRFGIVVLSPNFFAKNWTQKELGALTAREIDGEDIILPIWHKISIDEIRKRSPILADKFGISSEIRIDEMIVRILDKVQSK